MTIHKTVLLKETVDALELKPGMVVVDATLGGGGHSLEVLKKIGSKGKLIAFDQDAQAIARFKERLGKQEIGLSPENITLVHDNFTNLKDSLFSLGIDKVDAILADLGISSDQLEDRQRGISFQGDAPLDMRMDQSKGKTAEDVINNYTEQEIINLLREFADEKHARSIARNIVAERAIAPIKQTSQLVAIIERSVPEIYKRRKIHCATKTFQALRMEVNQELESLRNFLTQAVEILEKGARLAVITFHSGEDAMVKYAFRENARGCICPPEFPMCLCGKKAKVKLITRKPIIPSVDEIQENPRARSSKLRVIEKV